MAWRTRAHIFMAPASQRMPNTQEMTMTKFAIASVLSVLMVATASNAMAYDRQATGPEMDNQLNWQAARDFGGARDSARVPSHVRTNPSADQEAIDFQATGQSGSY
jgi:hypothetical protein